MAVNFLKLYGCQTFCCGLSSTASRVIGRRRRPTVTGKNILNVNFVSLFHDWSWGVVYLSLRGSCRGVLRKEKRILRGGGGSLEEEKEKEAIWVTVQRTAKPKEEPQENWSHWRSAAAPRVLRAATKVCRRPQSITSLVPTLNCVV